MRMLLRDKPRVASGELTLAFRRWRRPQVIAGRRYRTAAGRLVIDDVSTVPRRGITREDAVRAGYPSVAALLRELPGDPGLSIYRIAFHLHDGPDERDELANTAELSGEDVVAIQARLDRLDRASSHGPWTRQTLDLIAAYPGRRAPELAEMSGRERDPFKLDVRKLKNLGLTLSLPVGYQLSPRGEAYRAATGRSRLNGS